MPESNKSAKRGHFSKPLLVAIIGTVVLIIFIIIAILLAPVEVLPEFELKDRNGDFDAEDNHRIAVFDDIIHPDSHGEYQFIIKNVTDETLRYSVDLYEMLNTDANIPPFMQYKLYQDGTPLSDNYHTVKFMYGEITILPGAQHLMTLEWWWPFEIDDEHNQYDTLIGVLGGKLSVHAHVWAEIVEELW